MEKLSFQDNSFDCVFCFGVIFLTNWQDPKRINACFETNGIIYLNYNDLEWWKHLLTQRSKKEPHLIGMSCRFLINQFIDLFESKPIQNLYLEEKYKLNFLLFISMILKSNVSTLKKIKLLIFNLNF